MKSTLTVFKRSTKTKGVFNPIVLHVAFVCSCFWAVGKENTGVKPRQQSQSQIASLKLATVCSQSGSRIDLDVNNVRTKILGGGDMWWDLKDVKYEIPKDSKKHSLFAGSLWIGGMAQSNLKVAAMTYRQTGNDFWAGPLDVSNASVDASVCAQYDRHYVITRKEVEAFVSDWAPDKPVPDAIQNWPAFDIYNNANITQPLAPFYDADQSGDYNPGEGGDYPGYSLKGEMGNCKSEAQLFGDRTMWWVFNDKGNIHTESDGSQIGLEIHAQAFAFQTNDEINNMTFYQYQIFNRSTDKLDSCYLGMWVDPDLGNPNDDFIGCDVSRGLGYCYNGDADDDGNGENHYGLNPPAIGIDYFQGPLADADGIANPSTDTYNGTGYGDVIIDNERLGMEKFMFYRNDNGSLEGNPSNTVHYYNYLQGKWKDNNPITYGGTGHLSSTTLCNFMFPGNTDPQNPTPWYQTGTSYDGRFIHSSGPFTLKAGAVNIVTVGAVWARATSGGPFESVNLLKAADDKAQRLFDNCFQVLNGPDAPDLTIRELDRELILYLSNKPNSNNYMDKYNEVDPNIVSPSGQSPRYDSIYHFQGYQIFQMKNATASISDIHNPDLARQIAQCDIKDGVAQLVNFKFDQAINANVPIQEVYGEDKGLIKSFRVLSDEFATGDKRLINNKSYYFLAVAYAYNNYKTYDQQNPLSFDGQKLPYKPGRNNIGINGVPYVGIPHIIVVANGGSVQHAVYGQEISLTRAEGQGNGGHLLELTDASVNSILADSTFKQITYEAGFGPATVKIIDPLNVPASSFTLRIIPSNSYPESINTSQWTLTNNQTGEKINSESSIAISAERITDWGLSVTLEQCANVGTSKSVNNGYIESSIEFSDNTKRWLGGIPDFDGPFPINWIRSGSAKTLPPPGDPLTDDYFGLDNAQIFEGLISQNIGYGLGGTWAPYRLCSQEVGGGSGPAWKNFNVSATYPSELQYNALNQLGNLASVDIVLTADKSKWTRCPVFELCDNTIGAAGNARKFDLRKKASVNKEGQADNSGTFGMSWFPGYALNIETGERLNMAFGEDSHFEGVQNDTDLVWNPTANVGFNGIFSTTPDPIFGGKHYVYVFGHNNSKQVNQVLGDTTNVPAYDKGNFVYNKLRYRGNNMDVPKDVLKKDVFKDIMWCGIPMLASNHSLLECDVKIRLRVTKPYQNNFAANGFDTLSGMVNLDGPRANPASNNNYPMYNFTTHLYASEINNTRVAQNALQLINVVPNPYYGFSGYEANQADNQIKITNLPQKCTIKIYTLNGTLVREFNKDELRTSLNWDLKNQVGIPIASGGYLIHVDAPNVGEKIVKWFGALRPTDLDSY
ncbi:MAG: T9SS C-terminal target domain-containing protein [Bacteroidetes bacterium]|nr:T9SS C-terminal target domain-containing protein [Bacteroidota bacterium]